MSSRLPAAVRTAVAVLALSPLLACHGKKAETTPRPHDDPNAQNVSSVGKPMSDLFNGKFPGVEAQTEAGGGIRIRIRGGANSFYAGEEPLYILDETPLPPATHGFIMVNPDDVVRIEVLKNPADLAIYGMRGMHGVVKITTKRPGT